MVHNLYVFACVCACVCRQGEADPGDEVIAVAGAHGVADGLGHGGAHAVANQLPAVPGFLTAAAQAVNNGGRRSNEVSDLPTLERIPHFHLPSPRFIVRGPSELLHKLPSQMLRLLCLLQT